MGQSTKNKKILLKSLRGDNNLDLHGGLNPKEKINAERLIGKSKKEKLTLEISEDNIMVWSQISPAQEIYMYVFDRRTKDIWVGEITAQTPSVSGRTIKQKDEDYHAAIASMKTHMADLFSIYPSEMQILEAIDIIDSKGKISVPVFLRLLYKVLRHD